MLTFKQVLNPWIAFAQLIAIFDRIHDYIIINYYCIVDFVEILLI